MKSIQQTMKDLDLKQPFQDKIVSSQNGQQVTVVAKFWKVMSQMYPGVWLSTCGEVPNELWTAALGRLSTEQIRKGLDACITSGKHFPPSLPEFRALCKPPQRENEAMYRVPEDHRLEKKLSSEERATARSHIAEMKRKARENSE